MVQHGASNTGIADFFGVSVAVAGNTVVVGSNEEDSSATGVNRPPNESATDSGAAYVFVRNGTTWSQQAYLKASNSGIDDSFGVSVAVSGDTVVVGSNEEDSTPNESAPDSGAAYVFTRSGTTWTQQAYVKASNAPTGKGARDEFGGSVSVSGNTVVVGAPKEDSSTTGVNSSPNESGEDSGAAYVFVRNGTTWTQQAYLKASNTGIVDFFGVSVAVSGDTIVVGASDEDSTTTGVNSSPNDWFGIHGDFGAAYVFVRSGTTWSQQAYLKASNTGEWDRFGSSVAVSGDTVVVGAHGEDSSTTGVNSTFNENASSSGAAYVFLRSGTTWSQQAYLKASNTGEWDWFGSSVAVSGDTVVVGAHGEDSSTTGVNSTFNENASSSGAAYVFLRSGTTWSQQAYLKASNTGAYDWFGNSVAVSGDTLVAGASQEDSSTTDVNSSPNDDFGIDGNFGAAYLFVRSGTTWRQQAYLKVSNSSPTDEFGYSVAVSGNTVVVGATQEDSSTTGVNSSPNESIFSSGAAYVFVRSGMTWRQQAYLKSSNTGYYDYFGGSVAVSGDTVVVGASDEDSSTSGVNSTPNEIADDSGAAYIFSGLGPNPPEISIQQAGALIANGETMPFVPALTGVPAELSFHVFNTGDMDLNLLGVPKVAVTGSPDFTVTAQPFSPISGPSGGVNFTVRFTHTGTGTKTATLTIPNNDGDENPFTIHLTGNALSYSTDGDNDGLSDASEYSLRELGFIWNSAQPALVNTLFSNAAGAGLFTTSQVQALHLGSPLISRNPSTGKFKLKMDWKKSTNLTDFFDFPAPANSVSINPQGDIEMEFTSPDNAAFFRVRVE